MVYEFAQGYKLHQFDGGRSESVSDAYARTLPADTYQPSHSSVRFSNDSSYLGGFRSQGQSAQDYLETIAQARGYRAPEKTLGEYKDRETAGPFLQFPSTPL